MYEIHDTLEISAAMRGTWQKVVDLMAECLHVPAGLVMRVHQDEIEVLVRSSNPENVYHVGERAELNTGLYCETVMRRGRWRAYSRWRLRRGISLRNWWRRCGFARWGR